MITFKPLYGRLGEIMTMTYGLFYICIENDIPLNQIVIPKSRRGYDYYMNKSYPILENIEIFENIQDNLIDPPDDEYFSFNWRIIPYNAFKRNGIIQKEHVFSNKFENYLITDYWNIPQNKELFQTIFKSTKIINKLKNKYKHVDFDNACSLHVRRGDFVKIKEDKAFLAKNEWAKDKCAADVNQIENAIIEKQQINKQMKFLCVSDDIQWCHKNLSHLQNIIFVNEKKPCYAITLIGMCKYHVALNRSSFNWCGLMLSNGD